MATNSKEKQKEYDSRRAPKVRGWACIVYPESAPEGWIEALKANHIPAFISPLHDSDINPEDGSPKKPHYHVMLMFENAVNANKAKKVFSTIGVTAPPEMLDTIKGYARYLVHIDDHDKHRYDQKDITELCGACWSSTALDKYEETDLILDEIEEWIEANGVVSYRKLCLYARYERPAWKRVVRTNTIYLKEYMRSMVWEESYNGDI